MGPKHQLNQSCIILLMLTYTLPMTMMSILTAQLNSILSIAQQLSYPS